MLLFFTIACYVSAFFTIVVGSVFWLTLRRAGTLRQADCDQQSQSLDVIVPARNEQRDIEKAVRSILASKLISVRVIVINDHSNDQTSEIVANIASKDSRVTLINDPPLSPGWLGKANAMQHGLNVATGDYVLFTDADVVHAADGFAIAMQKLQTDQLDLLSLFPYVFLDSFWENVIVPHLMMVGIAHFLRPPLNQTDARRAAAAGAFILVRRRMLDSLGGLGCIRSECLDDVSLARCVRKQNGKTQLVFAPDLLNVRLFKSNREAFWGFTKNILGGLRHPILAVPAMLLTLLVYWSPIALVLFAIFSDAPNRILLGLGTYLVQALVLLLARPLCGMRPAKAMLFPCSAIPIVCCLAVSLYHHYSSGSVAWRGRIVPVQGANDGAPL